MKGEEHMKHLKKVLKVWGWLCLIFVVFYLCLSLLYANVMPYNIFTLSLTDLGEWVSMGLLSLCMARVIELLETK